MEQDRIQQKWLKWVKSHEKPWPGPHMPCGDGGYCADIDVPPYVPRPPPGACWPALPAPGLYSQPAPTVIIRRVIRRKSKRNPVRCRR